MLRKLVFTCVLCLAAGTARGQLFSDPDAIGFYMDERATWPCLESVSPYTYAASYLVATNLTEPSGLSRWEARVFSSPAALPMPWIYELRGGGVNELAPPYFRVALPVALPRAATITLMKVSTFYVGVGAWLAIGPCSPTSFPEDPGPGYSPGNAPDEHRRWKIVMRYAAEDAYSFWAGAIGYSCGTPVEPRSWSGVKALYQ